MSLKLKLSIAFALSLAFVAGLFLFFFRQHDFHEAPAEPESAPRRPAAPQSPAAVQTQRAPKAAVRKKDAPGKEAASQKEEPPPPGGGWAISGRIVRLAGGDAGADADSAEAAVLPAEGAAVHLKPHPRRTKPGEGIAPRTRKTGPDGRFEFTGVPAKVWLRFEVDEPSSAYQTLSFRLSDPDAESRKELGDILIEPGSTLEIHLVGPRGEPVEKATILMNKDSSNPKRSAYLEQLGFSESRRELTERQKGVYVLERVAQGPLHLDARASGFAPSGKVFAVLPLKEPLVINLLEGSVIAGRVLAADGKPVAGAELETGSSSAPTKTATDASGNFVFDAIGEGNQTVSVSAEGYVSARKTGVSAGTKDLEFTLAPEAVYAGKVLSEEDGSPVVKATVTLKGTGKGASIFSAEADAKGTFAVRKVTAGAYTVIADHPDFASPGEETLELKEGERVADQVLRLKRGLIALGKVLDLESQSGVPEAQVVFRVVDEAGKSTSGGVKRTARTGPGGEFQVKGLREGLYAVSATAKGYFASKPTNASIPPADGKELTVTLEQGSSVSGRVLDRAGQPIAGAMVRPNASISPGGGWDQRMNSLSNLTSQTDAEGAYRLEGLPPYSGYVIQAAHGNYAPGSIKGINVGQRESVEGADIVMSRGGSIQGRILDEEGKGISGAVLQATREKAADRGKGGGEIDDPLAEESRLAFNPNQSTSATSDTQGGYLIQHLEAGSYGLRAQIKGRAPGTREKILVAEEQLTDGVDLTLPIGETIAGRVVDAEGNPVSGADVRSFELSFAQVRTNAEGNFELKGLPAGRINLAVSRSGFEGQNQQVEAPGRELVFTLVRTAKVAGTIRAKGEVSFPGWQLAVIGVAEGGRPNRSTSNSQNDPSGRFETEVSAGTYFLLATVPGYAPSKSAQFAVRAGETLDGLVIDLLAGATIHGVVVAAGSGEAVSGASITVSPQAVDDPIYNMGWGRQSATSGADGTFTIEGVPEGTVNVLATHRDYAQATAPASARAGGAASVRLELTAGGRIQGLVTRGGQPLPGARVHAWRNDARQFVGKDGKTNAEGRYEIKGLAPGEYNVQMMGNSSRRSTGFGNSQRAVVFEGQATELNFDEGNPIRLYGRVTSGGAPVAGGNVSAVQVERGMGGPNSQIDGQGRYLLDLPRAGDYLLMINWKGQSGAKVPVTVPEGASEVPFDIELPAGELAGVVVDAETGAPVPGAQVFAFAGGTAARSLGALFRAMQSMTQTDSQGQFVLSSLPPGRFSLRAFAQGYADARLEGVEVGDAGGEAGLEIALERGVGLRMRVSDAAGRPVGGAMVLLRDPAGELVLFTRPFTSGPDGLVEIQGVRASGYRATVSHASYSPSSIDVQAGGADEPVVTLRPGGRVQVKVLERRGGRPAEGSEVELLDERGQNVAEDRFFFGPGPGQATVTDASGSLLLDQVAPGTYRLAAKRGKARSREEKVSVGEGQVAEKVLTLD